MEISDPQSAWDFRNIERRCGNFGFNVTNYMQFRIFYPESYLKIDTGKRNIQTKEKEYFEAIFKKSTKINNKEQRVILEIPIKNSVGSTANSKNKSSEYILPLEGSLDYNDFVSHEKG